MLKRYELLFPVVQAVKFFGGKATTNQIRDYLFEHYPDQDGYEFRWAQQELRKEKYNPFLVSPKKRGGEWSLVYV
jgi:hypothetical protein